MRSDTWRARIPWPKGRAPSCSNPPTSATMKTNPVRTSQQGRSATWQLLMLLPIAAALTLQAGQYGDFQYERSGEEMTIARYTGSDSDVAIPASIDGDPVTSIGSNVFRGYTRLTSVTIPYSVTSIEEGVFYGCANLTAIEVDPLSLAYSSLEGGIVLRRRAPRRVLSPCNSARRRV